MATVHGTVDLPVEDAAVATRRTAGEQGWAWHEGKSRDGLFVFKKGARAMSWGSELRVRLAASSPSATRLTITTGETFALTDLGRGRRAAHRLLDGLGAERAD